MLYYLTLKIQFLSKAEKYTLFRSNICVNLNNLQDI